jgi:hypothetical protein
MKRKATSKKFATTNEELLKSTDEEESNVKEVCDDK